MARKFFQRYLPEAHHVRRHRTLRRVFGELLHDPNLWHLNRRSAAGAMAVGVFCAFVPAPGQMLLAAALAILCRVNLPMSVALVWLTNPITIPPVFYVTYRIGAWLLGRDGPAPDFEMSLEWLEAEFDHIWAPLLLGSLLTGTVAAALGYAAVRGFWRWHVLRAWRHRRQRHRGAEAPSRPDQRSAPRGAAWGSDAVARPPRSRNTPSSSS